MRFLGFIFIIILVMAVDKRLHFTDKLERVVSKIEVVLTDTLVSQVNPVSEQELNEVPNVEAFILQWKDIAKEHERKFKVPASISLAQALVESRAGTSRLAVENNNHFGIKCFRKDCKQGHCTNHTDDTHKDFFRKFHTAEDSWVAHSRMISSGRYAKLLKSTSYTAWAYGLQDIGYATDPNYAKKLIGVIEKYHLNN